MSRVELNIKNIKTNLPFEGDSQILYDDNYKMENRMSKVPELNKTVCSRDFHVDATPDGKYAIRILKCYLERARVKFKVEDMEDSEIKLFDYMNECQDKRVVELEKAIKVLEGSN